MWFLIFSLGRAQPPLYPAILILKYLPEVPIYLLPHHYSRPSVSAGDLLWIVLRMLKSLL